MRWVALVLVIAGCGEDAGECVAPATCWRAELGVGTGTCDPVQVRALVEPTALDRGGECGPRHQAFSAGDDCTIEVAIDYQLTAEGPADGTMTITGDCSTGGTSCEHSFQLRFEETACASVDE